MHSCHNIRTDSNPIYSLFHIKRPLVATLSFLCVIFGQTAILSDQFQDAGSQAISQLAGSLLL